MIFDYCTIMVSETEYDFLPLHLKSLKKYNPDDVLNVKMSIRPEDHEKTVAMLACNNIKDIDLMPEPSYIQGGEGAKQCAFDTSYRMDKLMQSCSADWVILSHLDIIHTAPMIDRVRHLLDDKHSVVGIWPHGCTIINRKVYDYCHFKFWPLNAAQAVVHHGNVGVTIYTHIKQEREPLVCVEGIDVGMMIIIESRTYGYLVDIGSPARCYYHVGGLSLNEDESNRRRKIALEKFRDLK